VKRLIFRILNRFFPRAFTDFYVYRFMNIPMKLGGGKLLYDNFEALAKECDTYSGESVVEWYLKNLENYRKTTNRVITSRNRILLNALSSILAKKIRPTVLDFGGAVGEDYFMCRELLGKDAIGRWIICENEKVANTFKDKLKDEPGLSYISDVKEILSSDIKIDFVYLSGTLQYLKEPSSVLESIVKLNPEIIFINRTPMWDFPDRLTKQLRPRLNQGEKKRISYPCWILNKVKIINLICREQYKLIPFNYDLDWPYISGYGILQYSSLFFEKLGVGGNAGVK